MNMHNNLSITREESGNSSSLKELNVRLKQYNKNYKVIYPGRKDQYNLPIVFDEFPQKDSETRDLHSKEAELVRSQSCNPVIPKFSADPSRYMELG